MITKCPPCEETVTRCRDFARLSSACAVENEAAVTLQRFYRSYTSVRNAAAGLLQADAVLEALVPGIFVPEDSPTSIPPVLSNDKGGAVVTSDGPLSAVEATAVHQLVTNLRSDAAFLGDSSFTFSLRFSRFTVDACRFVHSWAGCRQGDQYQFSYFRGASPQACILEVRRQVRRGVTLTIYEETMSDMLIV